MMNKGNVTFRNHVADIDTINDSTDDNKQEMEICEITYPDGKVAAFPANDISPEDGRKYRDIYAVKYQAFKNADPDAERVKVLEGEIAARQAELDGLKTKPKDDARVQENLGYGKIKPDENPHSTDKKSDEWVSRSGTTVHAPGPAQIDQPVVLGGPTVHAPVEPIVPRGTPVPR